VQRQKYPPPPSLLYPVHSSFVSFLSLKSPVYNLHTGWHP